jgi:hypothetical protein
MKPDIYEQPFETWCYIKPDVYEQPFETWCYIKPDVKVEQRPQRDCTGRDELIPVTAELNESLE